MSLLARPSRKARTLPEAARAPLAAVTAGGVEIALNGVRALALPEGALWIESARLLVASDLHLEKGSAFAARGQMLPPYDTRATLKRLTALIAAHAPQTVISLGDSFHDVGGPARMDAEDRQALKTLTARVDWIWIEGNHDPEIPEALGGAAHDEVAIDALTFRHEPREGAAPGEVAGHLHPCAKVAARGRSVRARCFATDGARLVMPAFGAYAGGLNVCDAAFAPLFPQGVLALMAARGRVWPAAGARLLPD